MRTDETATWAIWASSFEKLGKHFGTDHYYSNQQKVWGWWFCSHIILINITRTSHWVCKLMYRQMINGHWTQTGLFAFTCKKLEVRLQKTK